MKDIHNSLEVSQIVNPAAKTADVTSSAIDLANAKSLEVCLCVGAITDGTHTPKLIESDDDSAYTDVAPENQLGTFSALAANTKQEVGYIGNKRYVKLFVTVAGATSGGIYGAIAVKSHALAEPV